METVFNLLATNPGNAAYYLLLIFSVFASMLMLYFGNRAGHFSRPTRVYIGLAIILAAVFLPALSSNIQSSSIYPILERVSLAWIMIWTAWLWLAPRPSKIMDIAAPLISVLVPVFLVLIVNIFPEYSDRFYGSPADIIWHFAVIFLALVFSVMLINRQTPAGSIGMGMLILMLAGFTISLVFMPKTGDISGAARWGILCAIPLLPIIALRQELLESGSQGVPTFESILTNARVQPLPDQLNTWLDAAGSPDSIRQQAEVARILCQALDAGACVFIQQSERPTILQLTSGYNHVTKTGIDPKEIPSAEIPLTTGSVQNITPSVIQESKNSQVEIGKFAAWLEFDEIHSMAVIPIRDSTNLWGAAVLYRLPGSPVFQESDLLPYTQTAAALTNIFRNSETASKEKQNINRLTTEIFSLREQNQKLQESLDSLRQSSVQVWPEPDINQMLTLQQVSQTEIDRIREENRMLLLALAESREGNRSDDSAATTESIEDELAAAREDLTQLQNLLNDSHDQVEQMEKRTTVSTSSMERLRKYSALSTQIRNPVGAITGYVDLLLSENEGQTEGFDKTETLENLKSALTHLRQIMGDLAQINILESGVIDLDPEKMDLASAIDQAVSKASKSLIEKGISLKISLPDVLPSMQTYRAALQKVIVYLLHNAGKVTPPDGNVELRVDVENEGKEPYLLLEVSDSGGGIPPRDINQVLQPAEQNEGAVQGEGDGGNGLSAAKTLIEAHGGRIWVDSNPGIGTTYSVLIPVEKPAAQDSQNSQ